MESTPIHDVDAVLVQEVEQELQNKIAKTFPIGKDNSKKAKQIAEELNLPYDRNFERAVRLTREMLVNDGVQACSRATGNGGYFIAATPAEAEEYAQSRVKRAQAEIDGANAVSNLSNAASKAKFLALYT